LLDLLVAVKSVEFLRHTLAKGFAAVFRIRWFRDIRNKAVGHFKRKYEIFMFVTLVAQFCGQSDLFINLYNI
jgi:hypothetical protein